MKKTMMTAIVGSILAGSVLAETQPDRVVEYKRVGETGLNLYIFNPAGHRPGDKAPAIVFFFGGGWVGGSPTQFYNQSRYLASRGMVAICADYRVKNRNHTSPKECVQDGKSAIRWVRKHADELGIDPNKIAAGGGSAGGHIAAAASVVKAFNEPGEDLGVSCRPNALVLFNPVFDNGPGGYGHGQVKEYWQAFSPLHNLDKDAVSTLVMLGTEDQLVPVATAKKYKAKMDQLGVRCDLLLYEGQPHGFFNSGSNYEQTVMAMDRFLTSLGFLKKSK